ncbi:MAG: CynX/NimT family MFS transporter, partial [Ilumatobacteraceae bacterium]
MAITWLVALNLRTGFIGLGPVLPQLREDLLLSGTMAALLVSIPTLMMGVVAVPTGELADRWGPTRTILLGLSAVAVGGALRAFAPGGPALLGATVLFGIGIGTTQPSLPRVARGLYPERIGFATGGYASGLITGSILAASLTLPVENRVAPDAGWRGPLLFWGVLALATVVLWVIAVRPWSWSGKTMDDARLVVNDLPHWRPSRDRRVWLVAALFGAQGLGYYLLVAWLPAMYEALGVPPGRTSALYTLFNAATLPAILLFPIVSDRVRSRRWPNVLASVLFIIGSIGLVVAPLGAGVEWLWPFLCATAVSGLFALTLVMPADVAPIGRVGAAAGMTLGIGYFASAMG